MTKKWQGVSSVSLLELSRGHKEGFIVKIIKLFMQKSLFSLILVFFSYSVDKGWDWSADIYMTAFSTTFRPGICVSGSFLFVCLYFLILKTMS